MHAHLPKNSNIYGWPLAQCISWDDYYNNTITQPLTRTRITELVAGRQWLCYIVYSLKLLQSEHPAPAIIVFQSDSSPTHFPNPCLQLTVLLFTVEIKIFPYGNWKVNAKLQSNLPMTLIIDAETTQLCLLFWPRKWAYSISDSLSQWCACINTSIHTFLCLSMDHMLAITHNYWVYVYLDDLHMQNSLWSVISYKHSKIFRPFP